MKKRLLIMGLTALNLVALVSCGSSNTTSNQTPVLELDQSNLVEAGYSSETDVIFSEYYEGSSSNRALELYNLTDNDVDLESYSIYLYTTADLVPTYSYKLKGTIKAKSTFVIVGNESDEEILAKADALSTFTFQGKQNIALAKNGKIVDVLGNIGYKTDWGKDCTFVRKVDHLAQEEMTDGKLLFDTYSWIKYNKDYTKLLGDVTNTVTPEELLLGPQLNEDWLEVPFAKYNSSKALIGSGGAIRVTLYRGIDGDTSYFHFPTSFVIDGNTVKLTDIAYVTNSDVAKVRYQVIDTTESYPGNIEEWGYPAKEYTTKLLHSAKELYVQTNLDGSLQDSYGGRIMGFVFCYGGQDIRGNDYSGRYVMSNFLTVKYGLSEKCSVDDLNGELQWKDIPYSSYFSNAFEYAKRNGYGLFGETDPYWDYDNNIYNGKEIEGIDYF
ncbi:MAG: lamin tail domain-containing protein [Bacilli bacterium]